ncbi:accessory gene regulator ArgB-like protein [Lachnobacterium bovis]|uniref:accessory gene regulator ArgB-like protein n=1 Tax=Lachnobacterium bovis TaxID=140626 RepID=UPI0003B4C0C9|nr:accessory gene regulator B family protein [Lachnobacterium bovis]
MIERAADLYARKQLRAGIIKEEDRDVYKYGYILAMEMGINILISGMMAFIFNMLECLIVFSCVFIPLRTFCGGWHASKSWICSLISNVTIAGIMIVEKYQIWTFGIWVAVIIELVCSIAVWNMAPIEHKNKPLSNQEKKAYRKICKVMYVVQLGLMFLFYCIGRTDILQTGVMAHIIVVLSLLMGAVDIKKERIIFEK